MLKLFYFWPVGTSSTWFLSPFHDLQVIFNRFPDVWPPKIFQVHLAYVLCWTWNQPWHWGELVLLRPLSSDYIFTGLFWDSDVCWIVFSILPIFYDGHFPPEIRIMVDIAEPLLSLSAQIKPRWLDIITTIKFNFKM